MKIHTLKSVEARRAKWQGKVGKCPTFCNSRGNENPDRVWRPAGNPQHGRVGKCLTLQRAETMKFHNSQIMYLRVTTCEGSQSLRRFWPASTRKTTRNSESTRRPFGSQFHTPKYTKAKVLSAQDKNTQLSSWAELHFLADANRPEYVDTHSLPTGYLRP